MELLNDTTTNSPSTPSTAIHTDEPGPSFNIRDIIYRIIHGWYWFVICMGISFGIAQYYLMSTNNVYTQYATLLIKDSRSSSVEGAQFADIAGFNDKTNIENELAILRSPAIMTEVVARLDLNNVYTVKEGLRTVQLYRTSPVIVTPADTLTASSPHATFNIRLNSATDFSVDGFANDPEAKPMKVKSGAVLTTPDGTYRFEATPNAVDYVGRTIRYTHSTPSAVAPAYAGRLVASRDEGRGTTVSRSSIITLSISDQSVAKADDILNAVIQVYNERWIQDKNQRSLSTSRFIDERLAIIESELGNVETDISAFKSVHQMPDPDAVTSMFFTQNEATRQQMISLASQIALAEALRDEVRRSSDYTTPLPYSTGMSDATVAALIDAYNTGVLERNRLISTSSETNPMIADLTAELRTIRTNILASSESYISTLRRQQRTLEGESRLAAEKLSQSPDQAKYLLSVERQQKVKESLYLYLLQKREENELSQAFTAYNTRVITPPGGSTAPTAPNRGYIRMVAMLIGFLVPAVVIIASELLNTTVRGRKDIEHLSLPFLGEIPMAVSKHSNKKSKRDHDSVDGASPVVVKKHSSNIINEAFRVVRSNLEFMFPTDQTKARIVAITSINPGSGKSFIAANLATVFALKGRRVLILDLDMRRATLSHRYGHRTNGMSGYLSGKDNDATPESLIIHQEDGMPDLIPVGPIPPNPSELLYSPRLQTLIDELRTQYDLIFIDCPPVEVVADTYIVNRFADLTIFVIRAGIMSRGMLPQVERLYSSKKLRNMGVLLNGTAAFNTYGRYGRYGYGYSYGYGYGYGYSYSHDKKKK